MAFRGPKVWLWRWRRNPLKRRADAAEAWVLLAAWVLTVLTGVLAGLGTASTVEQGMARERVEWRPVVALLTEQAPGTADSRTGTSSGATVWAKVRWSAPEGATHTGQARVRPGSGVGTPVTVWTDPQGRLVTKPATPSEARSRAALVGGLAGLCAASVPFVAGRALRSRLESRRIDQWGYEWARFGPLWGGRTTG
ncbi:Rv1733c family protein [Streptomyces bicolor]|uniref:Rv1733c family protein n=1 Tax=Streptomyces bicolor TaxID=66874 RepID=UPI0004E2761C|nr:membrane protein [Streptomyces bicolor]